MTKRRGIVAEDLYELTSVADPRVSPDGKKIAFVATSIQKEENEYFSNIYTIDTNTEEVQQWTFGEYRNSSPRWSPDGQTLAFVSNRTGKNQIYLLQSNGGEAQRLTDVENGATNPVWSPDGDKLTFTVSLKKGERVDVKKEKEEKKELEPLEVTKMKYKSDAGGFFRGDYQQIAIIDIKTKKLDVITEGEVHHSLQAWSPDGNFIVFGADYAEDIDFSFQQDLYLYEISTKKIIKITESTGSFYHATFSNNSRYLSCFGSEREYENATLSKIWLYDLQKQTFTCIAKDWDFPVGDYVAGDFQQGAVTPGAIWRKDDEGFYFIGTNKGNTNIYYATLSGELQQITKEKAHIYGLSIVGETAIAAISYPTNPSEIYAVQLTNGKVSQLTKMNEKWLQTVELAKPEPISFKGPDDWTVHGWLMKPANFQEGEKYPLILEVHGGPHAMYANTYFHEFQMLAASGYAVLYTNPRGSHGYGQAFVDAVRGDYGGNDYLDLMAAVDYTLATYDFIDGNRLGVTGGSYGGFMTNWIVSHTNRFKAAVTQRSISNWISFYGVSDIGYYFNEWQHKLEVNDIEGLWEISPLAYVNNVETPLLILHSEKDFRCPIEQAEQLFIALKHRKKKTKFIRFPESNHELSRSGKPNLRIKRLNYIEDWFVEHLN
ncbi:alpha/beta hydrolase family protein [Bacillus kwashiorkori]|uniref:alpha/beta hydrolase family protein n=1 Tax=Bacillus kwashiorkori TaxID=1522318 RepID=UPI0007844FBD|nr:S9 family peptidase [Bacillus kwashiorkori]